MKPSEFNEIKERFEKEQARWESLNVGDIIYDEQARGFDFDYHKMKILEINMDERVVLAEDVVGSHIAELSHFFTETEFEEICNRFRLVDV